MFQAFSPGLVEYPLRARWRRGVLMLGIGFSAAALLAEALRVAVAAQLGESFKLHDVQLALVLDPTNPQLHRRLGQIYLFAMEDIDPVEGVEHFRRATELNPRLASSWADLGSACDLIRDTSCSDKAFEQAMSLSPMSPDLRWLVGNHYLVTRRSDAALAHFHRLLELSPRYATQTFGLCLRALNDPQAIVQRVLPGAGKDTKLSLAFISFLSAQGKEDGAYQVWTQTAAQASRFEFSLIRPYLDRLTGGGRYREAAEVWRDLERLSVIRPGKGKENLIYNGDFEQVPLDAGLDWRFRRETYLAVDASDPAAYQGARCLRLDFTVSRNEEYEPVHQIVPVAPGQRYVLTAYVRSEEITSDSGPRLRIVDPACSECLDVSTEATLGTTGWHRVSLSFTPGAHTEFVRLSVWRPRSRSFPAEISGQWWVDAVSLRALNSASQSAASRGVL